MYWAARGEPIFAAIGDILSDPLLEAYLVSPRQPLDTED